MTLRKRIFSFLTACTVVFCTTVCSASSIMPVMAKTGTGAEAAASAADAFLTYSLIAEESGSYTVYDGTDVENYVQVNGRKYYQGILFERGGNHEAYCEFNVENVSTISFTMGKVYNSAIVDTVLTIYKDGVEDKTVEMSANETWNDVEIDVSDCSTLKLVLSEGTDADYMLGDFTVDGAMAGSLRSGEKPFYKRVSLNRLR